jgi:hypothetical protein
VLQDKSEIRFHPFLLCILLPHEICTPFQKVKFQDCINFDWVLPRSFFFDTFTVGEAPTVSNFINIEKGKESKVQRELQHERGGGGGVEL